ncbi:MAG: hypothetical protein R2932_43620 [Caldilineaceae bacterium]
MKQLRISVALLLVTSALFLYMEQQYLQAEAAPALTGSTALFLVLSLLLILLLPVWGRLSVLMPLTLWLGGLLVVKAFQIRQQPLTAVTLPIYVAELALSLLLVFLAHRVSKALHLFTEAIHDIVLDARGLHRFYSSPDAASEEIHLEFTRARAGERPLSLMVIEPNPVDRSMMVSKMIDEIQQTIVRRYTLLRMAKVIRQQLRLPDLLVQADHEKRILVLCPEADNVQSAQLLHEINAALQQQLGLPTTWSYATFPEEGLTFDGLLATAEHKLSTTQLLYFNPAKAQHVQPPTDMTVLEKG